MGEEPEKSKTLHWKVAQQLPRIIFELSLSTAFFLFDLRAIFVAATSQKRRRFRIIASPFATNVFGFFCLFFLSSPSGGKAQQHRGRQCVSLQRERSLGLSPPPEPFGAYWAAWAPKQTSFLLLCILHTRYAGAQERCSALAMAVFGAGQHSAGHCSTSTPALEAFDSEVVTK